VSEGAAFVPVRGSPADAGPACIVSSPATDAGACEDGLFGFDGEACRPACGGSYANEHTCITACLCDDAKLEPEVFTPKTECTWLRVFGRSESGAPDSGFCSDGADSRFACTPTWPHDPNLPPMTQGLPLGLAGVRIACDWSRRPDVQVVRCELFEE
jgi:hypothetical protein